MRSALHSRVPLFLRRHAQGGRGGAQHRTLQARSLRAAARREVARLRRHGSRRGLARESNSSAHDFKAQARTRTRTCARLHARNTSLHSGQHSNDTRPVIYGTVVRPVRQQAFLLYSHNFHKYKIHNLPCFKQTFIIFNVCFHSPFKLPKLTLLLCVAIDSQWSQWRATQCKINSHKCWNTESLLDY